MVVGTLMILTAINNIVYFLLVIIVCMFMFSCSNNKIGVIFKRIFLPLFAAFLLTMVVFNTNHFKTGIGRFVEYVKNTQDVDIIEDMPGIAEIAIGRGGLFGVGPGKSIHYAEYYKAQYGEFSYAILLEEWGIFGGLFVLLLYMVILSRIIKVTLRTNNLSQSVLVADLSLLILLMAFINMMACVGILPATGISMPLLSVDLSSVVLSGYIFGIILSISNSIDLT